MIRTTLVRASHAYKPMMRFPDRKAPKGRCARLTAESHEPKPHPDAPKEVADNFDHYKKLHDSGPHFNPEKLEQSGAVDLGPVSGDEKSTVFDLPPRFWNTPSLRWSPMEVDAINVCAMADAVWRCDATGPVKVAELCSVELSTNTTRVPPRLVQGDHARCGGYYLGFKLHT